MEEETNKLSLDDFERMKSRTPTKHRKSYYFRIDEYTLEGEYLRTWDSSSEAADAYGIAAQAIMRSAKGLSLYTEKIGRIFLMEGSSIKERLKKIDSSKTPSEGKPSRVTVKEYDLKGNLIMVYPSIARAADHCNINIETARNVISGKYLYTKDNRIFLREGEDIKTRLELIRQRNYSKNTDRSVDMYSRNGTPNGHFKNATEAAERFNVNVLSILDCCFGITTLCKGNIFLFSGDNIKERLKLIKKSKKDV